MVTAKPEVIISQLPAERIAYVHIVEDVLSSGASFYVPRVFSYTPDVQILRLPNRDTLLDNCGKNGRVQNMCMGINKLDEFLTFRVFRVT